jgi:cytoskeleton protein RodZ
LNMTERETIEVQVSDGPGARLRKAREERRLTVDQVARSLNLTPQRITALENDAYEQLPGATYVRGYVRNYAQLLGLPAQPLVDSFNELPVATQRAELIAPAPAPGASAGSDDVFVKVGVIGVAALLLGLSVLWWTGRNETQDPAAMDSDTSAAISDLEEQGTSPTEPTVASSAADPSAAPKPTEPAKPLAPATVNVEPLQTSDLSVERARLVLRLRDDSWVDIRDASDSRLVYQTLSAGRVVTVQGVPPLTVFLGNVDGVDVEFNGRPYDAVRHKRGEVARFTLNVPPGR